ncbi:flagellar hook protein FlgE [Bacillus manliponensis]|uniref:Flagellar hook protein FlgE n=1 Tax=Bacillus manliponensis TaxID=574376 RepID=A0A073K2F1_9BACI|nr:flagellar hook protein FlgE [Bacillus manliponensis]KEK20642.1 flagellar hook protein FlgE [Bacillus manliponensis]
MIKALYTSITGMNATQNALSVTSNNIANAQTVGYKRQKAMFDDLLYNNTIGAKGNDSSAGTNPTSIGNGVKLSGTSTDFNTGSITLTGGKMEAAIEGVGFFAVGDSNGGNIQYTRKGTFGISDDYYVVNSQGQYVFAYPTNPQTGEIDMTAQAGPLRVPVGEAIGGTQSTKGVLGGNINTVDEGITQDLKVFDDAGNEYKVLVEIKKTSDHNYSYNISQMNVTKGETTYKPVSSGASGNIAFNNVGEITSGSPITFRFNGTKDFTLDLSKLTNHPTKTQLKPSEFNGNGATYIEDYSISDGGYIMATYEDGSTKPLGQLAVATFPNEGGLMKVGNGNYIETPSTGQRSISVSDNVKGKATEGSNVDLSVEFVDLMLYQRGFQGNTKVIKVADEVLNDIVNLIR